MENLEKADIVTLALSLRHELDVALLARSFHIEKSDIKDIFNGYDSGMDTAILYVIKDLRELYQFSREDIETLFANIK